MQLDYYEMGVHVVFTGHDHIYSRIEKTDEPGLHYIISGNGGKSLYSCDDNVLDRDKFSVNCDDSDYGAVWCSVNSKGLLLKYYSTEYPEKALDSLLIASKH
jgi:hypothetical protein